VLIFDLRTQVDPIKTKTEANRVFSFPADTLIGDMTISDVMAKLAIDCGKIEPCNAETILDQIGRQAGSGSDRWVSHQGDLLVGYVVQDAGAEKFDLKIDEKHRNSQITADLGTLLKVIQSIAIAADSTNLKISRFDYTLTKTRANLTVKVTPPTETEPVVATAPREQVPPARPASNPNPLTDSPPAGAIHPPNPSSGMRAPAAPDENSALTADLVTGPREHWFLSVDLPVNKISELKFNEMTGKIEPKEKPSNFLIGIDYMLGDLFDDSNSTWWGGLTPKLMAEASSTPRNSLGFGLGYRLRSIKLLGNLELDTFSVFVGRIRSQEDKMAADGTVVHGTSYKNVIGLSFNIDKALDYLKK